MGGLVFNQLVEYEIRFPQQSDRMKGWTQAMEGK
jgi:hypothetical protein